MTVLEQIQSGRREFAFPISFTCNDKQYELIECLRFLPSKRAVFIVRELNQTKRYILKLFLPGAIKDFEAELRGHEYLRDAKIKTPELLLSAQARDYLCVLYQYIEDAAGVKADKGFDLAVIAIEKLHCAGLVQLDIHPDNFLIAGDACWVIDCASVSEASELKIKENKALFIAQFQWAYHKELLKRSGYTSLLPVVRKLWWQRVQKYLKKIFRDCTEVAVTKSFGEYVAYKRDKNLIANEFLKDVEAAMASGVVLKDGNSATVVRARLAGQSVVIKRYNLKNIFHAFTRLYRPSRAWNAWRAAHLLESCGINTPKPYLLKENRFGILRRNAYLITEAIDAEELTEVYAKRLPTEKEIADLKRLFNLLAEVGISHGDLKATNIMLGDRGLFLIDLDVLHELTVTKKAEQAHQNDKARFMKNWQKKPEASQAFATIFTE